VDVGPDPRGDDRQQRRIDPSAEEQPHGTIAGQLRAHTRCQQLTVPVDVIIDGREGTTVVRR
jgi:hypothetical protein